MKKIISNKDYVIFLKGQELVSSVSLKWGLQKVEELTPYFFELLQKSHLIHTAEYNESQCFTALVSSDVTKEDLIISPRTIMPLVEDDVWLLVNRGLQLSSWYYQHQFCGQCGHATQLSPTELAMTCQTCNIHNYPRISPCIMVLILRGDECLLAHHHKFPEPRYSTLAGFVEAGESLEATLHREVMEEVGLKVNNIRYFSSQPWPFPHQLMVCFMADYESGEIEIDNDEIADAQWFRYDQLPLTPPLTTISGKVIEAFVNMSKESNN